MNSAGTPWTRFPNYRHLASYRVLGNFLAGLLWIAIAFIAPSNLWLWVLPIVLGEFFIKLVTSSFGRELSATNYIIGAGLLGISGSDRTCCFPIKALLVLQAFDSCPITLGGLSGNGT